MANMLNRGKPSLSLLGIVHVLELVQRLMPCLFSKRTVVEGEPAVGSLPRLWLSSNDYYHISTVGILGRPHRWSPSFLYIRDISQMLTQETVGEKTHNEAVSRNRDKEKALANTIS